VTIDVTMSHYNFEIYFIKKDDTMKLQKTLLAASLAALLVGCGSSDSTPSTDDQTNASTAQFIDGYVQGLYYVNGSRTGYTNADGEFNYTDGNISFYLGNLLLGTIEAANVPSDNKVFVQDLLGVDRNETSNANVLKMARLLQTLDATPNSDSIEINATARAAFDVNTTFANFPDANITAKFTNLGLTAVKTSEIEAHLEDMRRFTGEVSDTTAPTASTASFSNWALDDELCIYFSERIPKDLITATNFTVSPTISGTLYRDNTAVCFTPDANLTAGQTYIITADGGITDYAGNALGADASVSYITTAPAANQAADWDLANGLTQTAIEGSGAYIIDLADSTDADSDTLTYEWFIVPSSAATPTYNQSSGSIPVSTTTTIDFTTADARTSTPAPLPAGSYRLQINQYEDRGAGNAVVTQQTVNITITAPTAQNTLPVLNVAGGLTQSVTSGNTFTIDVSGSTDADGDTLTYVWSLRNSSNTQVASGSTHTPITTTTQINSSLYPVGDYSLIIYLSDSAGAAGSNVNSTVDLEIVAAAPLDARITPSTGLYCFPNGAATGDTVSLSGSASTGNIVSWNWLDVTGNNDITTDSAQSDTSFFCGGLPAGNRIIRLTVTDNTGTTDTQERTVEINYSVY